MSSSILKRVISGSIANSFGQIIVVIIQICSLPIFLKYWDLTTYGTWIMLSTIPSYLGMTDFGLTSVATNNMIMAVEKKEFKEANKIFQSTLLFLFLICFTLSVIIFLLLTNIPILYIENLGEVRPTLMILSFNVLLGLFGGVTGSVFNSTNRYAIGSYLNGLIRLSEWGGSILGLVYFENFTSVAMGGLIFKLIAIILTFLVAFKGQKIIKFGAKNASKTEIISMIRPAFGFMILPLTNALNFQGLTLLVGYLFGPVAVVLFNSYRTIARTAVQINGVFSHALWPEFSRIFGKGELVKLNAVYNKSLFLGIISALLTSFIIFLFSPLILRTLSHDSIGFNKIPMIMLCIYAALGSMIHVPRILLLATNNQTLISIYLMILTIILFICSNFLGKLFGLNGLILSMIIIELISLYYCMVFSNNIFKTK